MAIILWASKKFLNFRGNGIGQKPKGINWLVELNDKSMHLRSLETLSPVKAIFVRLI